MIPDPSRVETPPNSGQDAAPAVEQIQDRDAMSEPWVVWSNEHGAWWGANHRGYYTSPMSAGIYTEAEAKEIERDASPRHEVAQPLVSVLTRYNHPKTAGAWLLDDRARIEAELVAEREERVMLDEELDRVSALLAGHSETSHSTCSAHLKDVLAALARVTEERDAMQKKADAYDRINTPELFAFVSAVENEALHQRERWEIDHDGGKTDADWFWLIGYLAGKALHNPAKPDMPPVEARLHRIITVAAAAANWHTHTLGVYTRMRPGIESPDATQPAASPEEAST